MMSSCKPIGMHRKRPIGTPPKDAVHAYATEVRAYSNLLCVLIDLQAMVPMVHTTKTDGKSQKRRATPSGSRGNQAQQSPPGADLKTHLKTSS